MNSRDPTSHNVRVDETSQGRPGRPCDTAYETRHGKGAIINCTVNLEHREILHHIRGLIEEEHRIEKDSRKPFFLKDPLKLSRRKAAQFRNKT
ncbi:hypothetical protein FNYG_15372 [Fusarium nygamai]|uniref:Uncharacterized protein n=1 Tax=Gibberella nygamai TaxID=42673 RepID=A0A2K0UF18_GIBNY|nr:hypothetical protein FNYG_15372 [Fusarium nygamai]